jgi:hypothetical protein
MMAGVQAAQRAVEALGSARAGRMVVLRPIEIGQQALHRGVFRRLRIAGLHPGDHLEFISGPG